MQRTRSIRPVNWGNRVSRTVLSVLRILIASYFLATATGLIIDPTRQTIFDSILPAEHALIASACFLFVTAFAIMVGKFVRSAALLLSIHILITGVLHFNPTGGAEALAVFWRDIALFGAVLLIAVTEPGGSSNISLWSKAVAPRRVITPTQRPTSKSRRPARQANSLTRDAILTGDYEIDLTADEPEFVEEDAREDWGADDAGNLFDDLWDAPAGQSNTPAVSAA